MYDIFDLFHQTENYFDIVYNDIFKMEADVLVFSDTHPHLKMEGSLCKEIYRRAGLDRSELKKNIYDLLTAQQDELFLFVTEGEKLGYKWLFHIDVPNYYENIRGENKRLENCYKLALQCASELNAESIVFPLLGTGSSEYSFDPVEAFDIVSSYINDNAGHDFDYMNITFAINDRALYDKLKRFEEFRDRFIWLRRYEIDSDIFNLSGDTGPGIYYPFRSSDLREIDKSRMFRNFEKAEQEREQSYFRICQEIKDQRIKYLKQNPQKTDKDFSMQMISDVINEWLRAPKEDYTGVHYERKDRSASELAEMICAVPSTVTTLSMGKGKFPSRDLLIALAIAMKLNREERVRFILYRNEDERYPHGTKEEVIEGILNDYNGFPDYDTVNQKLYEMTGMTIRKQPGGITKQKDKEKEIEHL